tara:strand:+ start:2404 stop:4425 length:2022 start_codon:yes stop_codon:yes gene_type:complete
MSNSDEEKDTQTDLELEEKAQVIAEATGRTKEAVLEDLMDDGIVNLSNEEKKDASLVEQLKEAAELISTVQAINKQVSDNSVLNGGNNKTEVAVETTLEGDIVDRAIASVERKAQNIRKIVVIIAPIMLLLTGGVGLDFFLDNDNSDGSSWEDDEYYEIWGCTAPDADNYNPDATNDDGTCYWDTTGPPCNSDWRWDAVIIQDFDANGEGFNNDLQIQMTFNDWNKCNRHMEGHFVVEIWDETRGFMWNQYHIDNKFHDQYTIDDHHYDLEAGDYVVSVEYHFDDSHWTGPSTLVTMESEPEPEPVQGCTDSSATNYNGEATEDDGSCEYPPECAANIDNLEVNQDGTEVEVIFYITQDEGSSCENFIVEVVLIPVDDNTNDDISHDEGISGTSNYYSHTFDDVPVGDWQVEAMLMSNGEELEVEFSSWIFVEEPETCEINLYDIAFGTNDTHATVAYDLDCGYGDESGGYNVSVQFMVIGNESYEMGYQFNNTVHYISGYVEDIHTLTLSNFTHENITHYDFAWFAIWGDENNPNYIERYWYNLPFTHPDSEPEPEACDNLTVTSNSLVLGKDSDNNLTLTWDITHDGPDDSSCYESIEIQITLYQNGTYYDISDFHKNGVHNVYASGTIYLDADDVELFGDLPTGTYEVLVKYRIGTDVSSDHFANSVEIE